MSLMIDDETGQITEQPAQMVERVAALVNELFPLTLDEVGISFPDPVLARAKILELEAVLERASSIQMQVQTKHVFSDGIYARQVFIPRGTLLTGRIHKKQSMNFLVSGDIAVLTEEGVKRLKPPFSNVSKAGIKRVGFAYEDTIWTTVHATNERDLEKLEAELFTQDFSDVEEKPVDVEFKTTMEGLCRQSGQR